MNTLGNTDTFLDSAYPVGEQLPRKFRVTFEEIARTPAATVRIMVNGKQVGNLVTDNAYKDDAYRFHDIFHFSYVAVLGWSPCVRNMLRKKRKSNPKVDEVEDGARAIITEEAISLLIFSYAREQNLFNEVEEIDPTLLETIERLTTGFEVKNRRTSDWQQAILMGYNAFRNLIKYKKGVVEVDMVSRRLSYLSH